MMCAWTEFISILPLGLREEVDRIGRSTLQELRLRINAPPELVLSEKQLWLKEPVTQEDLQFVINTASRYSPWAASTLSMGFLTSPGGHRIGVCGEVVCKDGSVSGMRMLQALCIRLARDYTKIAPKLGEEDGSILILGPPGSGKTTMLRDVIRQKAQYSHICVVDERRELFPEGFHRVGSIDILSGCPKSIGIEMLLKTMGPDWIAVDEITSAADCAALIEASNSGVQFLATVHSSSLRDLGNRTIYRKFLEYHIFQSVIALKRDKTWTKERMTPCFANGSARY